VFVPALWLARREEGPRRRGNIGRRGPDLHYGVVGDDRGTDWLFVGFALVRVLLLSAKHLFLAAKQWQFVPASG